MLTPSSLTSLIPTRKAQVQSKSSHLILAYQTKARMAKKTERTSQSPDQRPMAKHRLLHQMARLHQLDRNGKHRREIPRKAPRDVSSSDPHVDGSMY